jgi:hypothetical protein
MRFRHVENIKAGDKFVMADKYKHAAQTQLVFISRMSTLHKYRKCTSLPIIKRNELVLLCIRFAWLCCGVTHQSSRTATGGEGGCEAGYLTSKRKGITVENSQMMLAGCNQHGGLSNYRNKRNGTWNVVSLYRSGALGNFRVRWEGHGKGKVVPVLF